MKIIKQILFIFLTIILLSCNQPKKVQLVGQTQGTYYSITYFDKENRDFSNEIDSVFQEIDNAVSLWNPNSIISRINRNDTSAVLNQIFIDNFNMAQQAFEISGGAFDATIGPLVSAWGFHYKEELVMTDAIVDSIKQLVDYSKIKIENGKVIKADPRMTLDFNAVAQGYTSDCIGNLFISKGIESFLIDVGGEILAKGRKPNNEQWIVGIEKPAETKDSERSIQVKVKLEDKGLVTSGNYRKYIERDGRRYSHSINPKTGYPAEHSLLSATVMAKNAAWADCLATVCMLIGKDKAHDLIDSLDDTEAYFIYVNEENQIKTFATKGFEKLISNQ